MGGEKEDVMDATTCNRCGRATVSARARHSGYGERCRRLVYRAARVLLEAGVPVADKAGDLLLMGALVPHPHPGVWMVPSGSEAGRVYLAHPSGCSCPAGSHQRWCAHRVGACVLAGVVPQR